MQHTSNTSSYHKQYKVKQKFIGKTATEVHQEHILIEERIHLVDFYQAFGSENAYYMCSA
jgi:hypothetical protein